MEYPALTESTKTASDTNVRAEDCWMAFGKRRENILAEVKVAKFVPPKEIPLFKWEAFEGRLVRVLLTSPNLEVLQGVSFLGIIEEIRGIRGCGYDSYMDAELRPCSQEELDAMENHYLVEQWDLDYFSDFYEDDDFVNKFRQRWRPGWDYPPKNGHDRIAESAQQPAPKKKPQWHEEKPARNSRRAQVWKKELYAQQGGLCNGCRQWFNVWAMEVDHIEANPAGDRDVSTNLQLLCKPCNAAKGDRGMDYLLMRLSQKHFPD